MFPVAMKLALLLVTPLVAALGVVALFVYAYGLRLPKLRRRMICTELPVEPEELWSSLRSRKEVTQFGRPMPLATESEEKPNRLVQSVSESSFESSWTFELEPADGGTYITVVEESRVRPTWLRGFAALFLDQNAPLKVFFG